MKWIVANWKMNGTTALLESSLQLWKTENTQKNHVVLCPPYTLLEKAVSLKGNLHIGGQDCHTHTSGAFTGQISAQHLKDIGCDFVIIGHSECRLYNNDTNARVKEKANQARACGLTPIICAGESLSEKEAGKTRSVIQTQLTESLPDNGNVLIAYEPVWAIGTGKTPTLEEIDEIHQFIRNHVTHPILYGGSVTEKNAKAILALAHVNGVLVGGASLNPDAFLCLMNNH